MTILHLDVPPGQAVVRSVVSSRIAGSKVRAQGRLVRHHRIHRLLSNPQRIPPGIPEGASNPD